MSIRSFAAIFVGKSVRLFCRLVHRGGTSKPGEIALKICPDLLARLSKNVNAVMVTGTNGKTTATRIVEAGMKAAEFSFFTNHSGANLIGGLTTEFIVNSTLGGRCRYEWCVLETDEAASKNICLQMQPKIIFVTNLFRDQVDRFGDVTNTRDWIRAGIHNAPKATLVLNADCPVTASLAEEVPNRAVFYGLGKTAADRCIGKGVPDLTDCIHCGEKYGYDYVTYSHLGQYRCPKCGSSRPEAHYEVTDILSQSIADSVVRVSVPIDGDHEAGEKQALDLTVNLPAVYNIYNAIGAFAALRTAGAEMNAAVQALSKFKCGFGRMEALNIGKKGGRMILIKNDAGCNQVFQFLKTVKEEFVLCFYLNNNISDGVDMSWLKSAEFHLLKECLMEKVFVSGMCMDLTVDRLLEVGIPQEKIIKEKDCHQLIQKLNESELPIFILPSYTGMMETRGEIVKRYGGTDFWE